MEDLEDQRDGLDFDVAKCIRYHAYRRSFWSMLDSWAKIGTVLSGSAVIVSVLKKTDWTETFAFIVAGVSAINIVLGFSSKARDHDNLYREFSRLAQDIAENIKPTAEEMALWQRRRLQIEMNEPGIIGLLERRCSAEEAIARGRELRASWKLNAWQVAFSQLAMWPSIPKRLDQPNSK